MRRLPLAFLLGGFVQLSWAAPWEFTSPVEVTPAQGKGIFHHIESSGRKNIAVSGKTVGVIWEDNRNGSPQVYLATKSLEASAFTGTRRVSTGKSAYEPVIASLGKGRFIMAWEQDGGVWVRVGDSAEFSPPQRLAAHEASQVSLAVSTTGKIFAVWTERRGRFAHVRIAQLILNGPDKPLQIGKVRLVDGRPPAADQFYPSVAVTGRGVVVVWEDRRRGHTVLLYSHAADAGRFTDPKVLNEQPPPRSTVYGKGTGVARVALAPYGKDGVAAVWLDKRDFTQAYDVFAGFSRDGGKHFGPNQKVQDVFGKEARQWHAAIAGEGSGRVAVVWDDDRDGTLDIWLSWPTGKGWSEDYALPGGSGPGIQKSPSIAYDGKGNLHIVWVEQDRMGGITRIRYSVGRRAKERDLSP